MSDWASEGALYRCALLRPGWRVTEVQSCLGHAEVQPPSSAPCSFYVSLEAVRGGGQGADGAGGAEGTRTTFLST